MRSYQIKASDVLWPIAIDLLIAILFGLAFVGLLTVGGWTAREVLAEFTPLALGSLSILVAFTTLRISIQANRRQAQRQRDEGVRPTLFMYGGRQPLLPTIISIEACQACPDKMIMDIRQNRLTLENCGLGLATRIMFYVRSGGVLLPATNVLQKLDVGEKVTVELKHFLETNQIDELITAFFDLFGNVHYCRHRVSMDEREQITSIFNTHLDSEEAGDLWPEIVSSRKGDYSRAHAMEQRANLAQG